MPALKTVAVFCVVLGAHYCHIWNPVDEETRFQGQGKRRAHVQIEAWKRAVPTAKSDPGVQILRVESTDVGIQGFYIQSHYVSR